ncbi:MAG: hypothetical protein RLY20_320 [Verrucomicrobiota bacterium]|jgi:hypothetical protein
MSDQPHHVHGYWRRHVAALFRWLHIYLSMVSFVILFFFAITGITLNHAGWFGKNAASTRTRKGTVQLDWVKTKDASAVDKLKIVEQLRAVHDIKGALGEFTVEDAQCAVSFRGPGYTGDVTINRETAEYELIETRMGVVAILNDLHKGRDTGPVWSWIIDISAGLMVVVSMTGLVLIFFIKRRRMTGLLALVIGGLLCALLYWLCVP